MVPNALLPFLNSNTARQKHAMRLSDKADFLASMLFPKSIMHIAATNRVAHIKNITSSSFITISFFYFLSWGQDSNLRGLSPLGYKANLFNRSSTPAENLPRESNPHLLVKSKALTLS